MGTSLLPIFHGTVKDQGDRPTCVAFAVTAFHEYWVDISRGQGNSLSTDLSEEFLHFHSKGRDGLPPNSGTRVEAASTSLSIEGQCLEKLHPYRNGTGPIAKPDSTALKDGKKRLLATLAKHKFSASTLQTALNRNVPVLAVIQLFRSSYKPGSGGLLPEPKQGDVRLGLHAILLVGIEQSKQLEAVFKNSWGTGWGDRGFGRLSLKYLEDHCLELWTDS